MLQAAVVAECLLPATFESLVIGKLQREQNHTMSGVLLERRLAGSAAVTKLQPTEAAPIDNPQVCPQYMVDTVKPSY